MSIELAELTWGPHPLDWPMPPPKRPHFWNRQSLARLRDLEGIFGHLSNEALQRYWQEVAKGQSVYEDCGGYLLRCYRAMCGLEIDEPLSLEDAVRMIAD
jgi:hypothetical protein